MSDQDREQYLRRGAEIQEGLAKLLSDRLNIRVFSIEPQSIDQIYKAVVKDIPELKHNFSEAELRREVSNFISGLIVV